jgi:Haem-binding domain
MKYVKVFFLFLLGAFLIMQLIARPKKNINKGPEATANHISKIIPVPENIAGILKRACNDCHSNNTNYPWYANIMPVGWILDNHVKDGKKELNFDEFATYKSKRQSKKLDEVADEVKEGKMPIGNYTKLHKEARLTEEEKNALINWAMAAKNTIVVPVEDSAATLKKP